MIADSRPSRTWPFALAFAALLATGACGTLRSGPGASGDAGTGDIALWLRPEPAPAAAAALAEARRLAGLGRPADAWRTITAVLPPHGPDFLEGERFLQDLLAQSQSDAWILERYEERLAARPEDPDAWYLRARIDPSRDRQAETFAEALRREPTHAYARLGVALSLERAGNRRAADEEARRAAASAPWLALPWIYLGSSLAARGEDSGAVVCYQEAAARDANDARPWIGLLASHDDAGRAAAAARASLEALRCAPGDPGILFGTARVLERRGATEDLLRGLAIADAAAPEAGDRAAIAAFRGRCLLALGRVAEAESALAEATGGGWGAEVEAITRRTHVAGGRPDEAVGRFLRGLPEEAARAHPLRRVEGRRPATAEETLDVARAFVASGWLEEAALLLRSAPAPADPRLAEEAARIEGFFAFLREAGELGRDLRRRARRGDVRDLGELLAALRQVSLRTLGRDVFEGASVRSYPPLGDFVVSTSSEAPFRDEFLSRGLVVVAGRRTGAPADFFVSRLVLHQPGRNVEVLGERIDVEEHWVENDGLPDGLAGLRGGLAGLTLDRWVFVQLDAVRRRARPLDPDLPMLQRRAATDEALRALDTPSLVARRIELRTCTSPTQTEVIDAVRRHEYVHALDASRSLPVFAHPLRALWFAMSHGFSAAAMERTLEGRAAIGALADASDPRPALAALLSFLPAEDAETPHAAAYREIAADLVEIVLAEPASFPSIDRRRNIVQQLDLLTREEARLLARRILARM